MPREGEGICLDACAARAASKPHLMGLPWNQPDVFRIRRIGDEDRGEHGSTTSKGTPERALRNLEPGQPANDAHVCTTYAPHMFGNRENAQ
jgi:hypothetical protein